MTSSPDPVGDARVPAIDPSLLGGVTSPTAPVGGSTASTISSMDDLKQKAKPVYDAIMWAMALHMKDEQQRSNERLKKILNDAQQNR